MREMIVHTKSRSYPILLGSGVWERLPRILPKLGVSLDRKLFLITDEEVGKFHLSTVFDILQQAGYQVYQAIVPAGEESKSLRQVERLIGKGLEVQIDRSSVVLALGGGVVGDLAGMVAATFMRGVEWIQLPTTTLAHDSSIGGKVGVNHALGKNMIGAFHQPLAVVFDTRSLLTLPKGELISGYAELAKHAFLAGEEFVDWLEERVELLLALDQETVVEALARGCQVKAEIVSEDEREKGLRAILNYGHTIGHALEALTKYTVFRHGEAISIGMAGAARLSCKLWGASDLLVERTERLLQRFGLPIRSPQVVAVERMLKLISRDKKANQEEYTFVLARDFGKMELQRGVAKELIVEVLQELSN